MSEPQLSITDFPADTPPPPTLLDLPDGPLRLILSKLPLTDRFTASHVSHDLRRLLVSDPDPGTWGCLRLILEPPDPEDITLHPLALHHSAHSEPTTVVRLSAEDWSGARDALLDFALGRRAAGFCSSQIAIDAEASIFPELVVDGSLGLGDECTVDDPDLSMLDLWSDVVSLLGQAPLRPKTPLLVAYRYPKHLPRGGSREGPQPTVLSRFLRPLAALAHRPLGLDLRLGLGFEPWKEACGLALLGSLQDLSHVHLSLRDCDTVCDSRYWAGLGSLVPLPSISVDLSYFDAVSCRTIAGLYKLVGIRKLVFNMNVPPSFPSDAAGLLNLTRLELRGPFLSGLPSLHSLASPFPKLRSLLLKDYGLLEPHTMPAAIGPLPSSVTDLHLEFNLLLGPLDSFQLVPNAFADLETLTSLTVACIWESRGPSAVSPHRASFTPGPSLGFLSSLRFLRLQNFALIGSSAPLQIRVNLPPETSNLSSLQSFRADCLKEGAERSLPPHLQGRLRVRKEEMRERDGYGFRNEMFEDLGGLLPEERPRVAVVEARADS